MQGFRKFLRGTGGKVLLAVIIIPFIITAFYGYFTGGTSAKEVAKVEGTPIYWEQVKNEVSRLRENVSEQIPGIDERALDAFVPVEMGLEQVINETLVTEHIKKLGLNVSEEGVAASLVEFEEFQENGRFSAAALERFARSVGFTTQGFLSAIAQDQIKNQWNTGLFATEFSLPSEVKSLVRLSEQERDIEYAIVSLEDSAENYAISDEQVADYYEQNSGRYIKPEHFVLDYIELRIDELAENIAVSEQELEEAYATREQQFEQSNAGSERRSIAHIYFDISANEEEAKTELARIKASIEAGDTTFAEAAKAFSQDGGTAADGGSLGLLSKSDLPEDLAELAFSLAEGELSEPVASDEGYHLLLVERVQSRRNSLKPFAELKDELAAELREIKAEGLMFDKMALLEELAFEHADLAVPAEEVDVALKTTEPFSLENPIEGFAHAGVANELDNSSVREGRHNSRLLEIEEGVYLVFHVQEILPATPIKLAEVADEIRVELARNAAEKALLKDAEKVSTAIKEGEVFAELAALVNAKPEKAEHLKRYDEALREDLIEFTFSLQRSDDEKMIAAEQLPNGDLAIVHVLAVRDGELEDEAEELSAAFLSQLGQAEAQHMQQLLTASLRERSKVKIHQERIEQHIADEQQLYD